MDTNFEFGLTNAYDILPRKLPSIYQGSRFFITGRYRNPGRSAFSIGGYSVEGERGYDYLLNFSNTTNNYKFAEQIWAKEMIDDIERQIAVYGESDSLKSLDIELSLKYDSRKFTINLMDKGESFDYDPNRDYDAVEAAEERRTGGFGLFIIRRSMDDVKYETNPIWGNRLILVKNIP